MNMVFYYEGTNKLTAENVAELWRSVGWTDAHIKSPERLLESFKNSQTVYTAWINGSPVGLCSALTDGLNTWISCMMVNPAYQNLNIGGTLLEMMKEAHRDTHIYLETEKAEKFYAKHGFNTSICPMTAMRLDN